MKKKLINMIIRYIYMYILFHRSNILSSYAFIRKMKLWPIIIYERNLEKK